MTPLVSVIVPVYNTAEYLRECIDSIINQSYKNYEVILVDDGSKDNSGDICDEYARKYSFINVIHQENSGVMCARKTGFSKSRGKYISYIDSDDTIDSDMYEKMLAKAEEYDADVVICDIVRDTKHGKIYQYNYVDDGFYDKEALNRRFYPKMLFNKEYAAPGINPSLCNKIIRREVLEDCLMQADNRIAYGEDALCSYPCLMDAERVYVMNNTFFYHYRWVRTSATNIYDKELLDKFLLLIGLLENEFSKRGFDAAEQINCYAARYSLECIRKELLYNTKASLGERIKIVKEYLENDAINKAFKAADTYRFDKKDKTKISLAAKNRVFLLYMLFKGKSIVLKVKGI